MKDYKPFIRKRLFPDIIDWSSDHDELRYYKNWAKMPLWKFVIFHWLGTRMFLFLTALMMAGWCVYGIIYAIINHNGIVGVISAILFLLFLKATYEKMLEWKKKVTWTFYDLFFRDKWM